MFTVEVDNHGWHMLPGVHATYKQAYDALQMHCIKLCDHAPDENFPLRIKNETNGEYIGHNHLYFHKWGNGDHKHHKQSHFHFMEDK